MRARAGVARGVGGCRVSAQRAARTVQPNWKEISQMSKYVFSTLTANQKYPTWTKVHGRDLPNMESYVLIRGGANLPPKTLVTPKGVMTKITDEQYGRLRESPGFKQHLENGFLSVEDAPHDVDDVVSGLKEKDTSAPMVPKDFEDDGRKSPTTAAPSANDRDADNSTVGATQRPAQAKTEKPEGETPERKRRGRPPGSKNKAPE